MTGSDSSAGGGRAARSLSAQVFEGAIWTAARNLLQMVLSLLCVAVVARELGPQAYGVFGVAMLFMMVAETVTGGALADSLVPHQNLSDGHADAIFRLALCASIVVGGLLLLLAGPLTAAAGAPQAREPLMALALLLPLSASASVPKALLERELRFISLSKVSATATLASSITGIVLALAGAGVWALFFMEMARVLVTLIGCWWSVSWRPGWRGSWQQLRELSGFARNTVAMYAIGYADLLMPRLLISALLGPQVLGLYVLAARVFDELANLVTYPLTAVSMPACARARADREELHRLILGLYRSARLIAFPAFLGLAVLAPWLIVPVLGDKWGPAVPAIQIMMLAGLRSATGAFTVDILRGVGRSDLPLVLFGAGCLLQCLLIPALAPFGVVGMAWAMVGRGFALWPLACWLLARATGLPVARQLGGGGPVLLASVVMAGGVWLVAQWLSPHLAWPLLLLAGAGAGALIFAAVIAMASPATLRMAFGLLRAVMRRDRPGIERLLAGATAAG